MGRLPRTPSGRSAAWIGRIFAPGATGALTLALATSGFADGNAGVDVAHWNRVTSWTTVAAAGYGYVVVKATEGTTRDAAYARYRAGASAAGLRVGAYHFARPGGRRRSARLTDARAEADHFAAVAKPRAGDLLPVLDLEKTGGLAPPALIS